MNDGADMNDALELARTLEASRSAVMIANEPEKSAALFAPELRYIHSSGSVDTRDELLEKYRAKFYVYRTAELNVVDAHAFTPDLLWLRGTLKLEVLVDGADRTITAVYTAIWTRQSDTWRLAVHQSSAVKDPH